MAAAVASMLVVSGAQGAERAPHCKASEVRRTTAYVHRQGGPVDHATGCVLKKVIVPKSFAGIQSRVRALALTFVAANVARAFRSEAARRVAAADAKTDAALGADLRAHASPPPAMPLARVAGTMRADDGSAVAAETGTETKYLHRYTKLDTADDTGESFVTGSVTKATHVTGGLSASSSKELTVTHLINKCPDAGGIAHGTLDFKLRDLRIAGPRTIVETSTLHAQILAHFDDTAHIASAEVNGNWSFAVSTRHTNRSVGGDVTGSNFRQAGGSSYVDLKTTVTTGTDDEIVVGGGPLGVWVAEAVAHEYIENMLNSIPSGVCVNIVPDSPTVHVAPGGTVAIVAHLTDHHDQTFPGLITEHNPLERVSPAKADGNPDARFTYTAPASAKPGDTDVVQLSHVSKRGKGIGGTVNVIVDKLFPRRFDGTWTELRTNPSVRPGWLETLHGTASYVLDPTPSAVCMSSCVPYKLQSSSVDWEVSGSDNPSGECTNTYQGSGTTQAVDNSSATSQLTVEDVTSNAGAPNPEPQPYYYSIQARGDPENPPKYYVIHSPAGCPIDYQEVISPNYLTIGSAGNFFPGMPADQIQKSANSLQLSGHHVGTDEFGFTVDDTWSFTGSG
jgi:hypothetical protein